MTALTTTGTVIGHVFVNNNGIADDYMSNFRLDGEPLNTLFGAVFNAEADSSNESAVAEVFSLNLSMTVPVTAGEHTVDQLVGGGAGLRSFFYNRNHLTVQFVPQGNVVNASRPAGARGGGSPAGN